MNNTLNVRALLFRLVEELSVISGPMTTSVFGQRAGHLVPLISDAPFHLEHASLPYLAVGQRTERVQV